MEQQVDPRKLEMLMKLMEAEKAAATMSRSDGMTIYKNEPEAPGVYIDQYQQQQDAYNQAALINQTQEAFDAQENMTYAPPRANAFDISLEELSMGNPNYVVREEGTRVTVDSNGNIVRY